jgi:hypothetical protein
MHADSMQKLKIVHLADQELQQLTQEVKETIAQVKPVARTRTRKPYTAAQMWYLHRNMPLATNSIR